uniref:leucine-rich repeat-containing protein 72 isoform X1 n=1 Tax=Epinephelus lanceolatus TaxID=310571 RepID=UPI001447A92E|nr:leucine-rich repeat-containing protein 72 isoform X1 [Epinephelus lanceolatus]
MDHHTSGQHSQPGHSSSFQWLSFAYQDLTEIPYESILTQTETLEVLDLSNNLLNDFICCPSFNPWNPALLGQLEKLSTLILDCNNYTSHIKFPYMLSVTTVCINKNKINNLPVFVEEVRRKFPNIKILSMMNNEAAPSYFNGGSLTQYKDYRQYVISQLPGLEILDDTEVLEKERIQARKTYRLQQSSHSSRKRKEDSSKKHTHMQKKTNTVISQ